MIHGEMFFHIIEHAIKDCLKMLPFLFAAFLVLELLERFAKDKMEKILAGMRYGGPLAGALLGCVPQCGFSIIAASLYSGGVITLGTLLSVFLATSDEAVLILLGNPGAEREILPLLAAKVVIAVTVGYLTDLFGKRYKIAKHKHNVDEVCIDCGCHENSGVLAPALRHTLSIFIFLLLFTAGLNLIIEVIGEEVLARLLLKDNILQPFLAAAVGMIPNCVPSIMLTELYIGGMISFGSVIAGLCTGAGLGLLMLCKMNHHKEENVKVIVLLYSAAAAAGLILEILL